MEERNSKANAEDRHHRELLAGTAGGSLRAFGQLYDLLYTSLVRFIYRHTQSPSVVEEVLNDVMLVVWQKAGSFRGDSRVLTWVLGIARHCALNRLQRERAWQRIVAGPVPCACPGLDEGRLATLDALEWALGQLSEDHRVAIELAYFHGMSCEEIAEVCACPVNTAKTRLHYGRRRLHTLLSEGKQALAADDFFEKTTP
ncbi:sigma-70 family RNA polymerase sigma factor [Seongchinamella sediminis]|uniref:Sigma-70 family RNA polymerase sigma factor n=1 Tax=Seongchinamella sediminis TaxID=2283635 RepID=A0A3L7DSU7_9GAMM|nr:sigma-70 family RNA polymerase sigma factor [Seongchinamella sediminis]RLQ20424.1 sigma-70 family RNA polymerase sigma factor [Seongchinamella sediminis]